MSEKPQYRQDRAELLLAHQPGTVGDIADDGRLDEVALTLEHPAACDNRTVLPSVFEEPLDPLELRLVLDRSHLRARLQPVADDRLPREPAQLVADGVVDRVVDVEPLDGDASLAANAHGGGIDLRRHLLGVGVVEHDRRVVAAEFQGQALQRPGGTDHHLLACHGGAGERDLGHVRVAGKGGPEIVLIDDDVDDARRQEAGAEFAEFERRQRRGRGRLGHHRVAGEQRRRDLDQQQQQREVPRRDGRDDAERPVLSYHLLRAILLEHLGRQVERGKVAEPRDRDGDLPQRLRQRLALFLGQQACEWVLLSFESFGQLDQQCRPVQERRHRPGGERRLRSGHCLL